MKERRYLNAIATQHRNCTRFFFSFCCFLFGFRLFIYFYLSYIFVLQSIYHYILCSHKHHSASSCSALHFTNHQEQSQSTDLLQLFFSSFLALQNIQDDESEENSKKKIAEIIHNSFIFNYYFCSFVAFVYFFLFRQSAEGWP